MLQFRLVALDNTDADSGVFAAWELAALFLGEVSYDVFEIDEDTAKDWYIENRIEAGAQEDYRAEPQMAIDEMLESLDQSLTRSAMERKAELGNSYPFFINEKGRLERKEIEEIDAVGASYLTLQFFAALASRRIEVDGGNDIATKSMEKQFNQVFGKIFEYIAGYAVSGHSEGAPFMTSDCRSSITLEKRLRHICKKMDAGTVLPRAHWSLQHQNANDGKVDCLIQLNGPGCHGTTELLLVGATVQKERIDDKVMGPEKLDFFEGFFSRKPAAFSGVLVRPYEENDLTREKCILKDCKLYSYDDVWRSMGKRSTNAHQGKALKTLDIKIRRLLRKFQGAKLLHGYQEHPLYDA